MDEQEIRNRFGFHKATETTAPMHQWVRAEFLELALKLADGLPSGREKSLVLTSLQEAQMWANAAIACNLAPLVDE